MSYRFDVQLTRAKFPVVQNAIYFDTAHQSPLSTPVYSALQQFCSEALNFAGPKALWMENVGLVRKKLADFIQAEPSEIAFTKNTSEGLNIAANAVALHPGDEVLLIEGDHPNNAFAWLHQRKKGAVIRFAKLPAESAIADAATFAHMINSRTRVISLSHVSFHAGQRHDIESIGRLCKRHGIHLVVDAMQSIGVVDIDVKKLGVSFLAAGCHKGMLVPQGQGFLYVNKEAGDFTPAYLAMAGLKNPPMDFIARPDNTELRTDAGRFELGNYNLPALAALSSALDLLNDIRVENIEEHVRELGTYLIDKLKMCGIDIVGPTAWAERVHIYVLDLPPDSWLPYLTDAGIRVSPERDGIRVSFGIFNTFDDIDALVKVIGNRVNSSLPCA
jgi:selenocysteine lyase/cysteine desulfurase